MPDDLQLTPELLVRAYARGLFPMGDEASGDIRWYAPDPRAHLPLDAFHIPHNLRRRVRRREFSVTTDRNFESVIRHCADRTQTWITPRLLHTFLGLHERGYAHSVECWQDDELVGGLYGMALGGAFFGESMFYQVSHASKVALVHLVRQLQVGGFALLDTQYATDHLKRFGVVEIPRAEYERRLEHALSRPATWWPLSDHEAAEIDRPVSSFASGPPGPGNEEDPSV